MNRSKRLTQKKHDLNQHITNHSLWGRLEGKELTENQTNFLLQCLSENLEHARHVENERLTFNSIFLALVAGAFAFADSLHPSISCGIYMFLTVAGFLSMILTARWNNAFDRHTFYAQRCYKLLHSNLFGCLDDSDDDWKNAEALDGLNEFPMYCFKIHRPIPYTKLGEALYKPRTKTLYITFYWIIQILLILCTAMEFLKAI